MEDNTKTWGSKFGESAKKYGGQAMGALGGMTKGLNAPDPNNPYIAFLSGGQTAGQSAGAAKTPSLTEEMMKQLAKMQQPEPQASNQTGDDIEALVQAIQGIKTPELGQSLKNKNFSLKGE